jgi:putative ABC transport system permease protein
VTLFQLAWKNVVGSAFRSWVVYLCVLFVTGLLFAFVLLIGGARDSLALVQQRLGADVVVVPEGAEAGIESALLMGRPVRAWMPRENETKIALLAGVRTVSSQLYLASLANAPCCTAEMLVMAFDPQTDFTITPWLGQHLGHGLSAGEAVGGSDVFVPYGEETLRIYGSEIDLVGSLDRTGTGLDTALFFTFETAYQVAEDSWTKAIRPLEIPPASISAALVRVEPGTDPRVAALQIMHEVPGVTAIPASGLFQAFRKQIDGLLHGVLALLGIASALSLAIVGLIFSMAVNERRREIGIVRALGATQGKVLRTLLAEAFILALGGGATGILLAALVLYLFRDLIVISLAMPFLFPPLPSLVALVGEGLLAGLAGVGLAVLFPVVRASRLDPAVAMREQ